MPDSLDHSFFGFVHEREIKVTFRAWWEINRDEYSAKSQSGNVGVFISSSLDELYYLLANLYSKLSNEEKMQVTYRSGKFG